MKKLIITTILVSLTFVFSGCETTPEDQAYYERTADQWHKKVDIYREGQNKVDAMKGY